MIIPYENLDSQIFIRCKFHCEKTLLIQCEKFISIQMKIKMSKKKLILEIIVSIIHGQE